MANHAPTASHRFEFLSDPVRGIRPSRLAVMPQAFMRVTRVGADGVERTVFIGYVENAANDATTKLSTVKLRAPESLVLQSFGVPFALPLSEHITKPQVFEFWWKQLGYALPLPDPRSFPLLPDVLTDDERVTVERYVTVAGHLAGSALLNALVEGFNIRQPDGLNGPEEITTNFSRADLQAGFAAYLRQCDSPAKNEHASFHRVRGILSRAVAGTDDDLRCERGSQLDAWRSAANALHKKSLNQLIREKLASDDGVRAFLYQEEHAPAELVRIYQYGDLIHWEPTKNPELAEFERDPFVASDRRLAFLDAASGLAHLYIGFAELARTAVGRVL
jgi:hypothetical protein